jgi:hypothetical protein
LHGDLIRRRRDHDVAKVEATRPQELDIVIHDSTDEIAEDIFCGFFFVSPMMFATRMFEPEEYFLLFARHGPFRRIVSVVASPQSRVS